MSSVYLTDCYLTIIYCTMYTIYIILGLCVLFTMVLWFTINILLFYAISYICNSYSYAIFTYILYILYNSCQKAIKN